MSHDRERDYEMLRGLSAAAKLAAMHSLIRQAYELKAAWVRSTEPHLGDDEVRARTRELVVGGGS
jgi:hypothetical protein